MENDTDGIALIIIRNVECSEASVTMAGHDGRLRWTEAVYVKSNTLKLALQETATCYYQPSVAKARTEPRYMAMGMSTPIPTRAIFEQNKIDPLDLFLFHHRGALREYTLQHPESKPHIEAFLLYATQRYGTIFSEAESLFERGLVSQAQILLLFKPNDIILAGTFGQPAAFVLQEWPKLGADGWITLLCWSFQTDGSGFARKKTTLSISPIGINLIKIQKLIAYPLRFATAELQGAIQARG